MRKLYDVLNWCRIPKSPTDAACALPGMTEYLKLVQAMGEEEASEDDNVFSPRLNM